MDRRILVSAVGFRPPMVLPLAQALRPDEVHLICGQHPQVVKTEKEVEAGLRKLGAKVSRAEVDDWDALSWSEAIRSALDRFKNDHVTVNLTAGHGLAIAMLALHAAERALPVACYDWESWDKAGSKTALLHDFIRPHSPAAVLHMGSTNVIDRQVLAQLLKGPLSVSEIVDAIGNKAQSSVSTSLQRLLKNGFLDRVEKGRASIYSLRAGLKPMIERGVR